MKIIKRKPRRARAVMLLASGVIASIVSTREARASDGATASARTGDASERLAAGDRSPSSDRAGTLSGFVGWAFNIPLGSVRDFANSASLLGFELQAHAWLSSRLSLGVSGEWAMYSDTLDPGSHSLAEMESSARAYNDLQLTSVRLLAHYLLLSQREVQPYVGPIVGASWAAFDLEAGDVERSDTKFSVNVGAEAGILIPFEGGGPVAVVNLRYSTSPAAGFGGVVTNVQSLGLLLGIGF